MYNGACQFKLQMSLLRFLLLFPGYYWRRIPGLNRQFGPVVIQETNKRWSFARYCSVRIWVQFALVPCKRGATMIFCGKLKIQKRVEALQSLQKSKSTELPSTIPDGRYEMPLHIDCPDQYIKAERGSRCLVRAILPPRWRGYIRKKSRRKVPSTKYYFFNSSLSNTQYFSRHHFALYLSFK